MIKGIQDLKSDGYLCVTIEHFFITIFLTMVILLILLILFHHRDTLPEAYLIFFNLTL